MDPQYKYTLLAVTECGASVDYNGDTKKEALYEFDREYRRSGFKIEIVNNQTGAIDRVKKTHR